VLLANDLFADGALDLVQEISRLGIVGSQHKLVPSHPPKLAPEDIERLTEDGLSLFFLVFRIYTRLIPAEYRIDYFRYGRLGERYRNRPLIVPTVYRTIRFSIFALAFAIVQHLILGAVHGKPRPMSGWKSRRRAGRI
jgi:hypothetical protein